MKAQQQLNLNLFMKEVREMHVKANVQTWYGYDKNGDSMIVSHYGQPDELEFGEFVIARLNRQDADNHPCQVEGPAYDMTIPAGVGDGLLHAAEFLVTNA